MAVKIVWNMAGFRELRTAPGVKRVIAEAAEKIADEASSRSGVDGFVAEPVQVTGGRGRARAAVVTTTIEAMVAEARDHALLKAIDAARG